MWYECEIWQNWRPTEATKDPNIALGSKEERGLRNALHGAVELIASRVEDERREFFAAVLHDRFTVPPEPGEVVVMSSVLEQLSTAVRQRLEPLAEPSLTRAGASFLDDDGVDPVSLHRDLVAAIILAVQQQAAWCGKLAPLAAQLNADLQHAGMREMAARLDELTKAVHALGPGLAAASRLALPGAPDRDIPPPRLAPRLRPDFVPRQEGDRLLATLIEAAQNPHRSTLGLTSAALYGTGGFGKTTLAIWACHQPEVVAAFPGGVLWADLGQEPGDARILELLADLTRLLVGEPSAPFASIPAATYAFSAALADRRVLLVIDDVWSAADLAPFLEGGAHCVRLVTTRRPNLLPPDAATLRVDTHDGRRSDDGAAPDVDGASNEDLLPLFERSGRWPLLIGLINGVLRGMTERYDLPMTDVVRHSVDELERRGASAMDTLRLEDATKTIAAPIELSLEELAATAPSGSATADRYLTLAAFPEDRVIPYHLLERLWGTDPVTTRVECEQLANRSLLSTATTAGVQLHDVIRDDLRVRAASRLPEFSAGLLDASREPAVEGWHALPPKEREFCDTLAFHLAQAGRHDELLSTVTDLRFMAARLHADGPGALQHDVQAAETLHPGDPLIQGLLDTLRCEAHLLVGSGRRRDAAAALHSRVLAESAVIAGLGHVGEALRGALVAEFPFPDRPDPRLVRVLVAWRVPVSAVAWRGDGERAASASADGTGRIWSPRLGEALDVLELDGSPVTAVVWSPDLLHLAAATNGGTCAILDGDTGARVAALSGSYGPMTALAWEPGSRTLAFGTAEGLLGLWQLDGGESLKDFELPAPAQSLDWPREGTDRSGWPTARSRAGPMPKLISRLCAAPLTWGRSGPWHGIRPGKTLGGHDVDAALGRNGQAGYG
ncbi:MAG: NB-ARC domain-containing protein [Egibacteraceae bacterium]